MVHGEAPTSSPGSWTYAFPEPDGPHVLIAKEKKGKNGRGGGGEVLKPCMVVSYDQRPLHPYNAGMEHVGFSPTR